METTYYNSYYKLPDNRTIKISKEKFEAPEILFNPMLVNSEADGVHELVFNSINVRFYNNNTVMRYGYQEEAL
jgi:actin-related protein 2